MLEIVKRISANWQLFLTIALFISLLILTGSITRLLRAIKDGLKEIMTPLGIVVLVVIVVLAIIFYMRVFR